MAHAEVLTLTPCLKRNFKKQISEPVELALTTPALDMWDRVLQPFKQTLSKAESTYLAKAKSMCDSSSSVALFSFLTQASIALKRRTKGLWPHYDEGHGKLCVPRSMNRPPTL